MYKKTILHVWFTLNWVVVTSSFVISLLYIKPISLYLIKIRISNYLSHIFE